MKSFKKISLLLAMTTAAVFANADITSWSSSSSFFSDQYLYSYAAASSAYPNYYSDAAPFGNWDDLGIYNATNFYGHTDYTYSESYYHSALAANTPQHLSFAADYYAYGYVDVPDQLDYANQVSDGWTYLSFNLDSSGLAHMVANVSAAAGDGSFKNYSVIYVDGTYYTYLAASFDSTFALGAGAHTVGVEAESYSEFVPNNGYGEYAFSYLKSDYTVDITAVPEPASMLALGGVALGLLRRKIRQG